MTREKEIEAVRDEMVEYVRSRDCSAFPEAAALAARLDALQCPLPTKDELRAEGNGCFKHQTADAAMELAGAYWLRWVADQLAQGCYADLAAGRRDTLMRKHADELEGRR